MKIPQDGTGGQGQSWRFGYIKYSMVQRWQVDIDVVIKLFRNSRFKNAAHALIAYQQNTTKISSR